MHLLEVPCANCGHLSYSHDTLGTDRCTSIGCVCQHFVDPRSEPHRTDEYCKCSHHKNLHDYFTKHCEKCRCPEYEPWLEEARMEILLQPRPDTNKPIQTHIPARYDLILPDFLREVAEVLYEAATKYYDESWKRLTIDDHINHIYSHLSMVREGNTSERHFINITCRAMFAYWCDKQGQKPKVGGSSTVPTEPFIPADYFESSSACIHCRQPLHINDKTREFICRNQTCSQFNKLVNNVKGFPIQSPTDIQAPS